MEFDTEVTENTEDTGSDTPESLEQTEQVEDSQQSDSDDSTEIQDETEEKPALVTPFSSGKEKFKINGEEFEWDWETTKRYAQLGRSGQLAMEKAAQVEAKAKKAYEQILKAAQEDPEGLISILNPRYQPKSKAPQQTEENQEEADPRDLKIRSLEERLQKYESTLEQQEIAQAKAEIESELDSASEKFPIIKDEIYKEYVKNQYRKYLNMGVTDISIEDIAFQVHQKHQENLAAKEAQKKARLEQKRQNAPVHAVSGGSGMTDRKEGESGLEYAKRLAGLI